MYSFSLPIEIHKLLRFQPHHVNWVYQTFRGCTLTSTTPKVYPILSENIHHITIWLVKSLSPYFIARMESQWSLNSWNQNMSMCGLVVFIAHLRIHKSNMPCFEVHHLVRWVFPSCKPSLSSGIFQIATFEDIGEVKYPIHDQYTNISIQIKCAY